MTTLFKQNAASSQQRDQADAAAKALAATVQSDRAAVDVAQLNLNYSQIRSPIEGKTGPILVQPGNLIVANGTSPLVTIMQVQPVKVSFSLPQSDLPRIQDRRRSGGLTATINTHGAGTAPVRANIDFIGNAVSNTTGTIELRATFANEDMSLVPGQLIDVSVALNSLKGAIVLPREAVNIGPDSRYVYVVNKDGNAEMRPVTVLFDNGATIAVSGNLRQGDKVVTDGQLRDHSGQAGFCRETWRTRSRAQGAMNISRQFILRPVMTTLLMAAIVIFGIFGFFSLPISELPNVDFPTIVVSAGLPGADPETMASAVATPLESQFSTIAGISSMSSSSTQGSTQITIQFDLDRNLDGAAQDVQAAISAAGRQLPQQMPSPPTMRKVNPSDQPIMYLAMGSPTLPLPEVDKYAETLLARQLSTLNGVAQVNVYGSQKFAVRIQADPVALAARGIGIDQVATIANAANPNIPTGSLSGAKQSIVLHSSGQLESGAAFNRQVIAYKNGAPVRVQDVGARHRQRREQICGELVQRPARDRARDPAPARLQHHRRRQRDQEHPAALQGAAAGNDLPQHALRPQPVDPRLGLRCRTDARARRRSGRRRDLRLPANAVSDPHPLAGAAHRRDRHLRRHVVPRLQPGQSFAAGADAVGRFRRRRRHRHAREHRAPCRGRRAAAGRPR